MRKFQIIDSPCSSTGLKCIKAFDLTMEECAYISGVVTNNYMPSDDYKLGRAAGVFLQGYQPPMNIVNNDGYVMVEFWCRDEKAISAFIEHLENGLNLESDR